MGNKDMIRRFFKSNLSIRQRAARWFISWSIGIAVFANLIANDKPLYCRCDGVHRWPAFADIVQSIGWSSVVTSIDEVVCTYKIMPLIPFAAHSIDPGSSGYTPPGRRSASPHGYRHWLGTDALGRDVLAGLIYGARYAWMIGLGATILAALGGIFIGMAAGYWKNNRLTSTVLQIILIGTWTFFCLYILLVFSWLMSGPLWMMVILTSTAVWYLGCKLIQKMTQHAGRPIAIPIDQIILRIIDVFESFPKLFLLMALMVVLVRPSLVTLVTMIAIVRWPLFVQIARAETLKESSANYVMAAQNLGVKSRDILFKHIWPNIKPTLQVTAIFSISASILLEASLSFIGLGLRLEWTTWGSLLNEGRQYMPGWWLSVFPGLAIFMLLLSLNWLYDTPGITKD